MGGPRPPGAGERKPEPRKPERAGRSADGTDDVRLSSYTTTSYRRRAAQYLSPTGPAAGILDEAHTMKLLHSQNQMAAQRQSKAE